jgi:hypothetical protein
VTGARTLAAVPRSKFGRLSLHLFSLGLAQISTLHSHWFALAHNASTT